MSNLKNVPVPIVLDEFFIDASECESIKNRVLNLQHEWGSNNNISSFKFLPNGMYSCDQEQYSKEVTAQRSLMLDVFGDIYEKLVNELQATLNLQIFLNNKLHLPGFHISTRSGMSKPNFHYDGFKYLESIIEQDTWYMHNRELLSAPKIISVILPICLPKSPSGLIYKFGKHQREFQYNTGALAIWPGSLLHSVKPFIIESDNEYRITMQSHLWCFEKTAYLFW
jgi:hypothetical protein